MGRFIFILLILLLALALPYSLKAEDQLHVDASPAASRSELIVRP